MSSNPNTWEWIQDRHSIMVTNGAGKYLLTYGTTFTIAGDERLRLGRFHGSIATGICIMECQSHRREDGTFPKNVFKNIGPAIVGCATSVFDWNNVKFHFEDVKRMPLFFQIHDARCACSAKARIPVCREWFSRTLDLYVQVCCRHIEHKQLFKRVGVVSKRVRSESAAKSPKRVRIDPVETSNAK